MFFPMLSAELRIRVWKFALPRRRVVHLTFQPLGFCRYRSTARIPAVLQVCAESRFEALKHYRLNFGYAIYDFKHPMGAFTYFDPSVDTLYLNWKSFRTYLLTSAFEMIPQTTIFSLFLANLTGLSQVRSIAMCQEMWKKVSLWYSFSGDFAASWRASLKSLEEAILTRDDIGLSCKDLHFSEMVGREDKLITLFDFPPKTALDKLISFDLKAAVLTNNPDYGAILPRKIIEEMIT
ncbi:hypothetical protein DL95DRAFT_400383 [Leptodontidium sp. 2 PMI_412]|nr:hypothetical protein DL95DRAFT_400383 [Leptodontidium sp. 2 PMI_412]